MVLDITMLRRANRRREGSTALDGEPVQLLLHRDRQGYALLHRFEIRKVLALSGVEDFLHLTGVGTALTSFSSWSIRA